MFWIAGFFLPAINATVFSTCPQKGHPHRIFSRMFYYLHVLLAPYIKKMETYIAHILGFLMVWYYVYLRTTYVAAVSRSSLVTQPMLQLRPNWSELRSMDYYHQIFCRFRKCKQKLLPP